MSGMPKKLFGVGVINDDERVTYQDKSDRGRLFRSWFRMLYRCYSERFQKNRPSYIGCSVDERFHHFKDFLNWASSQVGFDRNDWQLDKDILVKGNKTYGPDTCAFVPGRVNRLLVSSAGSRGDLPVGVCRKDRTRFAAMCFDNGKQKYIGAFATPELAFAAYKAYKEPIIRRVAEQFKSELDPRVYETLMAYQVEITD